MLLLQCFTWNSGYVSICVFFCFFFFYIYNGDWYLNAETWNTVVCTGTTPFLSLDNPFYSLDWKLQFNTIWNLWKFVVWMHVSSRQHPLALLNVSWLPKRSHVKNKFRKFWDLLLGSWIIMLAWDPWKSGFLALNATCLQQ